jgi:hypothetical protein
MLFPAPLFGAHAAPPVQEAPTPAALTPLSLDYRILPQYRTHSPLAELIRKARQKEDDFPSERYSREIEGHFARRGSELCKNQNDLCNL